MTTFARHRPPQSIPSTTHTKAQQHTLARRLLLHPHSIEDLPPLLSSPNLPQELNAEFYDFIALALRAYVNPWWTKITRYDKEFLPQINRILTHVVHSLQDRIQTIQLEPLVFRELPTIVTQHYIDFRNAQSKLSTSYSNGGSASLSQLFAQLQFHMAISSDGGLEPEYFRQVVDHILRSSLPPEDYDPEVERIIIREILVHLLINDIIPKVTQPWFIQKSILDLLGPAQEELYASRTSMSSSQDTSFFHNLVVVILSALQSFSGACLSLMHAYKQAISTIKLVNLSPSDSQPPKLHSLPPSVEDESPTINPKTSRPLPPSVENSRTPSTSSTASTHAAHRANLSAPEEISITYKDFVGPPLILISEMIFAKNRFASTIILTIVSMITCYMMPFMDKLLSHLLFRALSPTSTLNVLRLSKRTLFPNGYPGPSPVEPSLEEQAEIRAMLVSWRGEGALAHLLPLILGPNPSATLHSVLDPLSNAQCNVRLAIFVLDRFLVALFPELVDNSTKSADDTGY